VRALHSLWTGVSAKALDRPRLSAVSVTPAGSTTGLGELWSAVRVVPVPSMPLESLSQQYAAAMVVIPHI
jgi:hypothetical protein